MSDARCHDNSASVCDEAIVGTEVFSETLHLSSDGRQRACVRVNEHSRTSSRSRMHLGEALS